MFSVLNSLNRQLIKLIDKDPEHKKLVKTLEGVPCKLIN